LKLAFRKISISTTCLAAGRKAIGDELDVEIDDDTDITAVGTAYANARK